MDILQFLYGYNIRMKKLLKKIIGYFEKSKHYTVDFVDKKYRQGIGKCTYGNPAIMDWDDGSRLTIGNYCSIANGTTIMLGGGGHNPSYISTYPFPARPELWGKIRQYKIKNGSVTIGSDVWIGFGVIILPGVKIGDGAVIGAGSVIAKNIPPYSIVVGNPARVIRKRFSGREINKLLQLRWWDWSVEKIRKNAQVLHSPNLNRLLGR